MLSQSTFLQKGDVNFEFEVVGLSKSSSASGPGFLMSVQVSILTASGCGSSARGFVWAWASSKLFWRAGTSMLVVGRGRQTQLYALCLAQTVDNSLHGAASFPFPKPPLVKATWGT